MRLWQISVTITPVWIFEDAFNHFPFIRAMEFNNLRSSIVFALNLEYKVFFP